jgi:hypothetical protein
MVLGVVVGAGFSAFESAGYAFGEMIREGSRHPVLRVLETQAFRAILSPFGHITWTAILGGAIFAAAWSTGRFRIDRRVVLAFVLRRRGAGGRLAAHGRRPGVRAAQIPRARRRGDDRLPRPPFARRDQGRGRAFP